MRQIDDSGEYETLLLPEDEGEANRFLFGTDDPEMLAEGILQALINITTANSSQGTT